MATRQITINDGSKKRKQVELNLNPVALSPTIQAGGNYRVAVQDTPKTNAAMQLSQALKQGVSAYGQAVDVAQKKAAEDVANMSDAEYEAVIQKGLDPEARNLFGYTKAYNRSLAQKYYATEIPTKLQELSNEMFKNYYDYKDVASFEAALEERMGSIYDEADQLLGGNVFGEQANNALKAATRADFIKNEAAKFSRELPKRNEEMAMETMARSVDGITSANVEMIFSAGDGAINANKATLGGRRASEAYWGTVKTKMETLLASKSSLDHQLLDDMIEEIGDGKGEENMVAGQELFATPSRQLYLTELERKLEERRDEAYVSAVKDAKPIIANLQAAAIRIEDEGDRKAFLLSGIEALKAHGAEFNGVTYENEELRSIITVGLNDMLHSPQLLRKEHATTYIAQEENLQASLLDSVTSNLPESYITRAVQAGGKDTLSETGEVFMGEWSVKRDTMYQELYDSVINIEDDGERRIAFKEGEVELAKNLKEWTKEKLSSPATAEVDAQALETQRNEAALGPERVDELRALLGENAPAVIKAEAEDAAADATEKATSETIEGRLVPAGRTPEKRVENFARLLKMKTLNEEDAFASFEVIHEDLWTNKTRRGRGKGKMPSEADKLLIGMVPVKRTYRGVTKTIKPDLVVKLVKAQQLANLMKIGGVPAENLIDGGFSIGGGYSQTGRVSMDFMMEYNLIDFTQIPITLGGNIKNTAAAVQAWKDGGMTLENVDPQHRGTLNKIAEKYEMSVSQLIDAQNLYLTTNGYLK
jgi:hypothetical protein